MFEYFKNKIYLLLDQILEPFWSWLNRSSWTVRVLVFLLGALTLSVATHPQSARDSLLRARCYYRVLTAQTDLIPLDSVTRAQLKPVRSHLVLSVKNDVSNLQHGILTPWSSAQASLALLSAGEIPKQEADGIVSFIRSNKDTACGCWHELLRARPADPVCLFASGWIFAAMADMHVPAQEDELAFLLHSQSAEGWWSMYPVSTDQKEFASTYATGWIIIGLQSQLDAGLISSERREEVSDSIRRGAAWLLSVREDSSRWRSYPNKPGSKISDAISGLVIHSLHHTIGEQTGEIERAWLANLPGKWTTITDTDPVYVEVISSGRTVGIDQFIQIRLPWMLVATIDSYRSGSLMNRSAALFWLEKVLSQKEVAQADVGLANWWRAELLFSLGHVLHQQGKDGVSDAH